MVNMSIATPAPRGRPLADRRPNPASSFPNLAKAFLEVSAQARDQGLLKRAPWFYLVVGIGLTLALLGVGTGFILLGQTWWQLLIAAALGVLMTQVSFITHEAAHRTIFSHGPRNDRLARLLAAGVVGISYSWWDSKHSRHHGNPNKIGKDPDIAMDTVSFLEEDAAKARGYRRWIIQRQGWLFFPLLSLEGLNLHYQGLRHLMQRGPVRGRWLELSLIIARFVVFLGLLFWVLPFGMAIAFLAVQLVVFGVYMGASFAPNHKGMPIIGADERLDFFSKQVRTSRNVKGGWWATWLFGGLNYQVEHHLFPNMARPHLAQARKIVRAKCAELDVPYTETSLGRTYVIVIEYLNRVGLAARDPFECPMTATLRRG
jgi:fatty acid desaturase